MQFINWRFWVGLAVSGLFLLLLLLRVDRQEIVSALSNANYFYVVPAIGLYFVAVYFRSVRWSYLLSPIGRFPVNRLYPVVIIGYMANNLLPARLGELVRSYYLAKREAISGGTALATVAVERLYDGIALLFFAAISAPLLLKLGLFQASDDFSRGAALFFAIGTVAMFSLAFAFLVLAGQPWFSKVVDVGLSLAPSKIRPTLGDLVHRFIGGLGVLNSPRRHLGVFLLSWPVWLFEGAMYLLVGYSFDLHLLFGSFWTMALVMMLLTATSNLATALPSSAGGIGPFEVVATETLVALGVSGSVGAVYAVVLHLVALWLPVTLLGLVLLWRQNLSLKTLAGKNLIDRTGETTGASAEPESATPESQLTLPQEGSREESP